MRRKVKLLAVTSLLNLNFNDVARYVMNLHSKIKRQRKQIRQLNLKVKKITFLSKLDAHIAKTTNPPEERKAGRRNSKSNTQPVEAAAKPEENVLDFVNEIKAQATINSFQQAGFIYEPTSGLYYDTKSTYYYSPQHDLYYNGNDGSWYRLNPRTNEFIFHSGTDAGQAVKKEEIDEDEAIRKILEDGRKTVKSKDSSSKNDDKVDKESKRSRRYSDSSSDSSDDSHRRRRRRKSRSRSRSRRSRSKSRGRKRRSRERSRTPNREDGELDTSDGSSSDHEKHQEVVFEKFKRKRKKKKGNEYEEIAKKYPPSLRLIVIESDKCDVGKLFLVTFKGGSLGREGNHEVLIPDLNISKTHLKFTYNHKKSVYQLVDRSRNGTLLDGVQVSSLTQEDSKPSDLEHGNVLQLSKTKLLCHVHEGLTTCDECEPYNYAKKSTEEPKSAENDPQPSNLTHKEQLKLLQKRYGLATEKYLENPTGTKNKNYEDRAEKRRVKVGSSHESVKTQQASVNASISSENKGFKLLSKMGWSEGKSIGKSQEGIKEPVQLKTQQGTSGLGCETEMPSSYRENTRKKAILSKTQERYNSIRKTDENIFGDDDDDD